MSDRFTDIVLKNLGRNEVGTKYMITAKHDGRALYCHFWASDELVEDEKAFDIHYRMVLDDFVAENPYPA